MVTPGAARPPLATPLLRALILLYNNVRGPTFPEIQKHFNLRERSQS